MPETTVIRGEVVVDRGEIVGRPGHGRYAGAAASGAVV
jgi:hypothetical protein